MIECGRRRESRAKETRKQAKNESSISEQRRDSQLPAHSRRIWRSGQGTTLGFINLPGLAQSTMPGSISCVISARLGALLRLAALPPAGALASPGLASFSADCSESGLRDGRLFMRRKFGRYELAGNGGKKSCQKYK